MHFGEVLGQRPARPVQPMHLEYTETLGVVFFFFQIVFLKAPFEFVVFSVANSRFQIKTYGLDFFGVPVFFSGFGPSKIIDCMCRCLILMVCEKNKNAILARKKKFVRGRSKHVNTPESLR